MMSRAAGIPRQGRWSGPAVLGAAFRPFFLLAGLWAVIAVPLWLAELNGHTGAPDRVRPSHLAWPRDAVRLRPGGDAGFLLTAVPNWTGRLPIQGWRLGVLALVFVAGRVAVACSARIGPAAAAIDLAFPLLLLAALTREVVAGHNWRSLPMLGALGLIAAANGLTHLEALRWRAPAHSACASARRSSSS